MLARRSRLRVLAGYLAGGALLGGLLAGGVSASAAVAQTTAAGQTAASGHLAAARQRAAVGHPAQTAAPSCQVTYAVQSDWGTGFTLGVTIQNTGPAITSWTLAYTYAGNQALSSGW
ncbi:MAG TPA: cellulose binding domain-containing protein, partial [Streptosporangiaceae bacterium]|nr:cellulose binding domain-containing protein [Streptosporangiaceae bacterium]